MKTYNYRPSPACVTCHHWRNINGMYGCIYSIPERAIPGLPAAIQAQCAICDRYENETEKDLTKTQDMV